ncbi:MAG: VCBS repeat-containing protein [Myxococcales bacterium]|nr:VCBS repeat-containing protein [Myxococcales bacterium]
MIDARCVGALGALAGLAGLAGLAALASGLACVAGPEGEPTESDGSSTTTASSSTTGTSEASTGSADDASSGGVTTDPTDSTDSTGPTDPPPDGGLGPWGFGYVEHPELVAAWLGFGHFDGGDSVDLLLAQPGGDGVSLLGDGAGGFEVLTAVRLPSSAGFMRPGDFDADGNLDAAVFSSGYADDFSVLLGDGTGHFPSTVTSPIAGFFGFGALPMRYDADDALDVFVPLGHSEGAMVAVAEGDGSFAPGPHVDVAACYLTSTAVGDVDGDGLDDVIGVGSCNATPRFLPLMIYRHDGGSFALSQTITGESGPVIEGGGVLLLDVDDDGDLDIVTPTLLGVYVVHNLGDGTFEDPPAVLPHELEEHTRWMVPVELDDAGTLGLVLEQRLAAGYSAGLVIPDPTWTSATTEPLDLQGRVAFVAEAHLHRDLPQVVVRLGELEGQRAASCHPLARGKRGLLGPGAAGGRTGGGEQDERRSEPAGGGDHDRAHGSSRRGARGPERPTAGWRPTGGDSPRGRGAMPRGRHEPRSRSWQDSALGKSAALAPRSGAIEID